MNDTAAPNLEKVLGELTTWSGPAPALWRRALTLAGEPRSRRWPAFLRSPLTKRLAIGGVAAAVLLTIGVVSHEMLGAQRAHFWGYFAAPADVPESEHWFGRAEGTVGSYGVNYSQETVEGVGVQEIAGREFARVQERAGEVRGAPAGGRGRSAGVPYSLGDAVVERYAGYAAQGVSETEPAGERRVVRKATIELVATDVRTAFFKASHLVSAAQGEYVQDSSLTGTGTQLQGTLTLRIAVARLSDVLNELRALGEVRVETNGGEDVTAQVVDVEARLRNEQRVEQELLELLDKRSDAPLKEILDLRTSLGNVRQSIEQLIAQREQLGRLVALATVLVVIHPADAKPPPPAGLAAYFRDTLRRAWRAGLTFLVDTVAGLVAVVIGGLIWWILLVVVALSMRAYLRRRRATAA